MNLRLTGPSDFAISPAPHFSQILIDRHVVGCRPVPEKERAAKAALEVCY
jgi:hypothetical protein